MVAVSFAAGRPPCLLAGSGGVLKWRQPAYVASLL